jgi:hypothetical protein
MAVVRAALAQELIAQQHRLIAIQPEASDEAARSRRMLHMLHEMRMLFLADVERWAPTP